MSTAWRRSRLVLALCIAPLFHGSASAGVNQWTVIGPPASVQAMAADPQDDRVLYAAGFETVARTYDRGITWSSTEIPGLAGPVAIRVAPSIPSTIYVLGFSNLFRSTSGGQSWVPRSIPSAVGFPNDLQVHATNADVIVVACSNFCFFGCSGGGVYRSDNGGGTWRRIGLKDTNVYEIALDPTNAQVVYARTETNLFKTINGGGSWKEISLPASGVIHEVAVDPVIPTIVYAAADSGIFKSFDAGVSWTLIRPALYGSSVAIDPADSSSVLAAADGMIRSFDGGHTWQELNAVAPGIQFNSLRQILIDGRFCYKVSDLVGRPGQILQYEILQPRRRAAP